MKHSNKVLSFFICLLFVITILQPMFALADDENATNTIDSNVQNKIAEIDKEILILSKNTPVFVSNYNELKAAIDNESQNIYLTQNIELEDTLQIGYDISFNADSGQKVIYSSQNTRHINITSSDILICFNGIILDGNCTKRKEKGGGIDAPFKNIDIYGAVIKNCNNDLGSAILNELENELGTFTLYNCIISDNLGSDSVFVCASESLIYNCTVKSNTSGGLCLGPYDENQHSNVLIYSSTIKNNSYYDGGGLNIYWSDVYIDNSTAIENNTADDGGGIYLWECNLKNHGTIKNNSADNGGGIYAYNSQIINHSEINNNTAKYRGGGVALEESTIVLESGEIAFNRAGTSKNNLEHSGGGICIYYSSAKNDVVINNGVIKNNVAALGAGISYDYRANFNREEVPKVILNNGSISENGYSVDENGEIIDIANEGGGIFGCYVEMNGGIIEKNIARYGAGIKTLDFIMKDGLIQNNGYYEDENGTKISLSYWGGGVYSYGNTTISGGTINSNQSERGAGLYIVKNLTLGQLAKVENNIASDVGGGIYFCHLVDSSDTNIDSLKNNFAFNDGDQFYLF